MQRRLRLRQRDDFARLRTAGQTTAHRLCVLSYRPNGLSHHRYGFIVMRRLGKAVLRNRIRRHLREAIRQRQTQIGHPHHQESGYDMVLIARPPIATASFAEICQAVDSVLQMAHLLVLSPEQGE
jgi:ribonuclease P protein component